MCRRAGGARATYGDRAFFGVASALVSADEEQRLRRSLLHGGIVDRVERAHALACLLEAQGRLAEALVITEAAVREGPDFGRGELRGVQLMDALAATWGRIHRALGRKPTRTATALYNAGLAEGYRADWRVVLAEADRVDGRS